MIRQAGPVRVMTVSGVRERMIWWMFSGAFLLGAVGGHVLAGSGAVEPERLLQALQTEPVTGADLDWNALIPALWTQQQRLLLVLVLSFSVLGVVLLPLLLLWQGFGSGCAVSVLVRCWGVPGLTAGAVWIGLERLWALWALLLACVPGWELSRSIAAGERMNKTVWTGCVGRWLLACLLGLGGSVVCRWLICRYLARLLWAA